MNHSKSKTDAVRTLVADGIATVALASGGMVHGGNFANTYAPSLAINVNGSGNPRSDANLASQIAAHVDRALKANRPDNFRRSQGQTLANQAMDMRRAASRNG